MEVLMLTVMYSTYVGGVLLGSFVTRLREERAKVRK